MIWRRFSPVTELTAATIGFSATGIFPRLIHGDALALCFARALFATVALAALIPLRKVSLRIRREDVLALLLMGLFTGGNWAGFFAAIKVAGVSVAVIALFTNPLIAAVLEPWIFDERHDRFEILAGLAVLGGVFLVVPSFHLGDRTLIGVLLGIGSALSLTLRNLIGRRMMPKYGAIPSMFWQFSVGILLFLPFGGPWISRWTAHDWLLLAFVGVVLTSLPQTIFLANLARVTSRYASLLTCAQPVITVVMAVVFLGERPTLRTLLGGAIVTATVVCVGLRRK